MLDWLNDFRFAARSLRRSPGFSIAALLTLALGIGMTTAVFSVVYGVLYRPLPYPNADRVVSMSYRPYLGEANTPLEYGLSPDQLRMWRERASTTSHIGLYDIAARTMTGVGEPTRLTGAVVTTGVFETLGTPPLIGRTFVPEDEARGAERVVILSYGTWTSRFGRDRSVVNRTIVLDNHPHRIVGIMPKGFGFPSVARESAPMNSEGAFADAPEFWVSLPTIDDYFPAIALLKPGVTLEQAVAEGSIVLQDRTTRTRVVIDNVTWPSAPPDFRWVTLARLGDLSGSDTERTFLMVQAGVMLVFLIACANVINLLVARATHRRSELAVRAAVGATRARLFRYSVAESLLLSGLAGVLGSALALAATLAVRQLPPHIVPRMSGVQFDLRVLGFVCTLSAISGGAVGVIAASRVLRRSLWHSMQPGTGRGADGIARRQRPSHLLVVGQIAGAMVLLAAAGLILNSVVRLVNVRSGVDPDRAALVRVSLPKAAYTSPAARMAFVEHFVDAVRAVPGVRTAAIAGDGAVVEAPFSRELESVDGSRIARAQLDFTHRIDRDAISKTWTSYRFVTPGFITTTGTRVLLGRDFVPADARPNSPAAIVNQTFASRHFNGVDPIGHHIGLQGDRVIVGVVEDVRAHPQDQRPLDSEVYLLIDETHLGADADEAVTRLVLVFRGVRDPLAVMPAVRLALSAIDPRLAAYDVTTMSEFLSRGLLLPRLYGVVSSTFAAAALMLSCIGLYGILAYAVTVRQREFGVRIALGAEPRTLLRSVMRQGMAVTGAGVLAGGAGAYYVSQSLQALLFGITPRDPVTFATVATVLLIVGAAACYFPARRAMRVDPVVALRCE